MYYEVHNIMSLVYDDAITQPNIIASFSRKAKVICLRIIFTSL